jgi:hypothetical protein
LKPEYVSKHRNNRRGEFEDSVDEYGDEDQGAFEALNKEKGLIVAQPGSEMQKKKPGA